MNFTHLHVHTEYSLLDGSGKIKEMTKRAAQLGMNSLAITDHGVMYGAIDFYKAALENNIKPIIGCEVYVAPGSRFEKETENGEDRYYHLVLLAENNKGYRNLCKIVSAGFVEGFYYKPRVDEEILRHYSEGIICLSACLAGEVPKLLQKGEYDKAKVTALKYADIFGRDNYFLELQDHGIPEQSTVNANLLRLSEETGIELVCTNDVHYTYADDVEAHDILLCIQTGKKQSDKNRMRYEGGQYYLKSKEEMAQLFKYAPKALENTQKIADRCNVDFTFGVTQIPNFDVPKGYDAWSYLKKLCEEGLKKRYPQISGEKEDVSGEKGSQHEFSKDELYERLYHELDIIKEMGYIEYFLIVWDFIHYAKSNGIAVGPGRGSAAGSIVSYCLEITDIDPMRYNLLFERFLNPERVSMPDIDVDFCIERRQEVIDYVGSKYGKDHVAQIVTFGTLKAKAVVRDVGRVLDMPYSRCDEISKMIPKEINITLNEALKQNNELRQLYEEDEDVKKLIDMSKRLEGLPRHASMHAAGVVICASPVDDYVPLSRAADGSITTQYVMTTLEQLGLLKMDFLGLRNLTVIQNTLCVIKENRKVDIDLHQIDYDDKKVLDYIGTGNTEGIFQLESAGMKNFMKELRPKSLEDIIAGISLYRPGPMDFIPQYLSGKNHPEKVTYDCPQLRPILEPTYGCIIYQEQVMQIVRDLAGFSMGRSDNLRRAMSKKKQDVMNSERKVFVYGDDENGVPGCVKNGIDEKTANKIYDDMIDFAKYAFNKSHAAAYAVVAYQTAYLKYYYKAEFMAAMLTSVMDNTDKVSEYIYSCKSMGINILPPDINEGSGEFSAKGDSIRYGLTAIKNVGKSIIESIINEREENGKYIDLEDFVKRALGFGVNKRAVENFIKSGAFDCFKATRKQMMTVYAEIIDSVSRDKKDMILGQVSLFDMAKEDGNRSGSFQMPDTGEYTDEQKLDYEKEVLGIYVKVGGIISAVTKKLTKSGQTMAFVTLEDLAGTVEIIIFPRQYEENISVIKEGKKIFVSGQASIDENADGKVIANEIIEFSKVPANLMIGFASKEDYVAEEPRLLSILSNYKGNDRVVIVIKKERQSKVLSREYNVDAGDDLVNVLRGEYGEGCVKIEE